MKKFWRWITTDAWLMLSINLFAWSSRRLRRKILHWLKILGVEAIAYRTDTGQILCVAFLAIPVGDLMTENNYRQYMQVCHELELSYKSKAKVEFKNFDRIFDNFIVESFSRRINYER